MPGTKCFYDIDEPLEFARLIQFTNGTVAVYKCPKCSREYKS